MQSCAAIRSRCRSSETTEASSVSFRGGTYVRSANQIAIWVRKRDSGLAAAIVQRPRVSLVFLEREEPGARYLAIEGRARLAPELDQEVYDAIVEPERQQDPERLGVAVLVDVDSVTGAGENGFFERLDSCPLAPVALPATAQAASLSRSPADDSDCAFSTVRRTAVDLP